jgi:hypothetical protein
VGLWEGGSVSDDDPQGRVWVGVTVLGFQGDPPLGTLLRGEPAAHGLSVVGEPERAGTRLGHEENLHRAWLVSNGFTKRWWRTRSDMSDSRIVKTIDAVTGRVHAPLMNAAAQSTAKIAAVKITINRAEGPTDLCRKPQTFEGSRCWTAANAWLMGQSETFPAEGGYDKHDFTVEFADGESYSGRLDCKASDCEDADLNVGAHVRDFIEFMAGVRRPAWMNDMQWARALAQYADERPAAVDYLNTYAIPR